MSAVAFGQHPLPKGSTLSARGAQGFTFGEVAPKLGQESGAYANSSEPCTETAVREQAIF